MLVDTLKQLTCLLSQIACNPQNSIATFFAKSSFHNFFNLFIITASTEVQLSTDYRVAESLSSGIKTGLHKSYMAGLDLWKFINKKSFHNKFVILHCYDENFYYEIKGEIKFVTKSHQKTKKTKYLLSIAQKKDQLNARWIERKRRGVIKSVSASVSSRRVSACAEIKILRFFGGESDLRL